MNNKRSKIIQDVYNEIKLAKDKYPKFHSLHEGYAVIKEELDELWDEIKKSKKLRANIAMRNECIQIMAMSLRFIEDLY